MTWRAFTFGAIAAAACAVAACSAIAGLGGRPVIADADAAVGLSVLEAGTPGPCESCAETKCGPSIAACRGADSACATYEDCLVLCAGDYACRSQCLVSSYSNAPEIPAVDQCMAANCSSECGSTCGMTSTYAEPDAAVACEQCLGAYACDTATRCGTDLACQQATQCSLGSVTIDRFFACVEGSDAGAMLTAYAASGVPCGPVCGIGHFWACTWDVLPPTSSAAQTRITLSLVDHSTGKPIASAEVQACAPGDLACAAPVSPAETSDGDGNVTFDLVADAPAGFHGYFEVTAPSMYPELLFLQAPLSVPNVTFPSIQMYEPWEVASFYTSLGETADPSRGALLVEATDCHWAPASGLTLQLVGDGGPGFAYFASYEPSAAATATDSTGFSVLLNAPPLTLLTLTATPPGFDEPMTNTTIFTRAGTLAFELVRPQGTLETTLPPQAR